MPPTATPPRMKALAIRRRGRRRGRAASSAAYALFYSGVGLGIGLLAYAGFFLTGPPQHQQRAKPQVSDGRVATIQFDIPDGRGQCRQRSFNNISGRIEETGSGPCRSTIPEELRVDADGKSVRSDAIARAFRPR